MSRRVVRAVALVSWLAGPTVTGQTPDPPAPLDPGRPIERSPRRRAEHRYPLTLRQGERAEVAALQHGLDLAIRIVAPDGKVLGEYDEEAIDEREEQAEVVAIASGTYTLIVSATWPRAAS